MLFASFYRIIGCTLLLTLLPLHNAEARNRHSLLGKLKQAFSSNGKSEPRRAENHGPTPSANVAVAPPTNPDSVPSGVDPLVFELRRRADQLAQKGLRYRFGGSSPREGGMDCSGTMMYLLQSLGFQNVPRTSYAQYQWLKENNRIRRRPWGNDASAYENLRPGDLVFWGGTYNSGHKVSHVMMYLGKTHDGRHYMFGARGKKNRGLHGSGVDVFELKPGQLGNLVGYGSVPGTRG